MPSFRARSRTAGDADGAVSPDDYKLQTRALKNFLEGRANDLMKELQAAMQDAIAIDLRMVCAVHGAAVVPDQNIASLPGMAK